MNVTCMTETAEGGEGLVALDLFSGAPDGVQMQEKWRTLTITFVCISQIF